MTTLNYSDGSVFTPGTGLTTAVAGGGRTSRAIGTKAPSMRIVTGFIAFDSSYPTGGEDISDIFNQFRNATPELVLVDQPLSGAQTGKFAKVDYTNKKIQLFTNASPAVEVANASDQSAITRLGFIATGPL